MITSRERMMKGGTRAGVDMGIEAISSHVGSMQRSLLHTDRLSK